MRHTSAQRLLVRDEPLRNRETETDGIPYQWLDRAAGFDRDRLTGPDLIRGAVHPLAVDEDVTVADELPGLGARAREPQAVDDVVQPLLELA